MSLDSDRARLLRELSGCFDNLIVRLGGPTHPVAAMRLPVVSRLNELAQQLGFPALVTLVEVPPDPKMTFTFLQPGQRVVRVTQVHVRDPYDPAALPAAVWIGLAISTELPNSCRLHTHDDPNASTELVRLLKCWPRFLETAPDGVGVAVTPAAHTGTAPPAGRGNHAGQAGGAGDAYASVEQTAPPTRAIVLMLEAQRSGRPIPSVKDLAETVGCDRSTLFRDDQFMAARKAMKAGTPPPRGHRTDSGDIEAEAD